MKFIAVIAEFNPFHTGHAWLLSYLHSHDADAAVIVIMSGSFVQRGEPALFDKWHRAAWAVQNGADCVLELPVVYALSSAAGFALGGVQLASRFGCTTLACGVEGGTAADFHQLAAASLNSSTAPGSQTQGQLRQAAIANTVSPETAALLDQPNNLLAMEYARAIHCCQTSLSLYPVRRSSSHNDNSLGKPFVSASALRLALQKEQSASRLAAYLPGSEGKDINNLLTAGAYTSYERYGEAVLLQNRLLSPQELHELPAFNEGLENRWYRCFSQAVTYPEALQAVKTKRYAYSRLCRMGAYTLLRLSRTLMDQSYQTGPQYARVLALNARGAACIRSAKQHIVVVNRIKDSWNALSPLGQRQLALDVLSTDLQYYCFASTKIRKARQDYYHSPLFF